MRAPPNAKTLRDFFDGDWNLALASYNAVGAHQRAVGRADRGLLEVDQLVRVLPRETRDYVPMIMAAIVIAGIRSCRFEVSAGDPLSCERIPCRTRSENHRRVDRYLRG